MASDSISLARTLIDLVGGSQNIAMVAHCVTRLRFRLRDSSLARTSEIEALDEVLQVVDVPGQYQIVIGPEVFEVYDAIVKSGSFWEGDGSERAEDIAAKRQGASGTLIDLVSSIVAPALGCLASTSMVKGLLGLWDFLSVQLTGVSVTQTGGYLVLYAIADGFMVFLPIMAGVTAARRFKMNELIGASLGAALCYPTITALSQAAFAGEEGVRYLFEGTLLQMPYATTFFGIPLVTPASSNGYTATLLPVIIACWVSSYVFRWANRTLPSTVKLFLTPMITLLVGGVAAFLVIGPVATVFMNLVGVLFAMLLNLPVVGGTVGGAVLGAVWQILVIFGFHWALVPITLSNLATYGYDFALPGQFGCTWAQIACVLVVVIKTKDETLRKNGIAAFITGIFGTTEPAIYGVTLPLRLPFVLSCVAGAVSGAFYGLMGNKTFILGYSGLLGITSYIDSRTTAQVEALAGTSMYLPPQGIYHMAVAAAGVVIAFAVGFVLTWLFWRPKEE